MEFKEVLESREGRSLLRAVKVGVAAFLVYALGVLTHDPTLQLSPVAGLLIAALPAVEKWLGWKEEFAIVKKK